MVCSCRAFGTPHVCRHMHPPKANIGQINYSPMTRNSSTIGMQDGASATWPGSGGHLVGSVLDMTCVYSSRSYNSSPSNRSYLHPVTLAIRHSPDLERGVCLMDV